MASSEEAFKAFYEAELLPILERLERKRQRLLWQNTGLIAGAAILSIGAYFIAPPLAFLPAIIAWLFYLYGLKDSQFAAAAAFKQRVMPHLVRFVNASYKFDPLGGVDREDVHSSGLVADHFRHFHSEDMVWGTVGSTRMCCSQVEVGKLDEADTGKQLHNAEFSALLKGMLFVLEFNNPVEHRTWVFPDHLGERVGARVARALQKQTGTQGELIELEDETFERYYKVYGEDQVSTRYVLTPAMMQALVEIREELALPVSISFVGQHVPRHSFQRRFL